MRQPKLTPIPLDQASSLLTQRKRYLVHVDGTWRTGVFTADGGHGEDKWWSFDDDMEFYELDGEDGSVFEAIYSIE